MKAEGRVHRPARDASGYGLPASVVLHLGMATAALVAWQTTPPLTDPDPVIAVDVISDALSASGDGSDLAEAGPPVASIEAEAPPAPDAGEAPPEPAAAPVPAPQAPVLPPPPPEAPLPPPPPKAPPPRPAPTPATRPPPPRPTPQAKAPSSAARPAPPVAARAPGPAAPAAQANPSPRTSPKFDVPGANTSASGTNGTARTAPTVANSGSGRSGGRNGGGSQLTGDLNGMLLAQIRETYNVITLTPAAREIVVVLQIELNAEGVVRGTPRVVAPSDYSSGPAQTAVEAAMRAVQQRRQFDLPEDRFDEWRIFRFRFVPRELGA